MVQRSTILPPVAIITLIAIALLTGGCGQKDQKTEAAAGQPAKPVQVVASFYPLYEFVYRVGGDRVQVRNLVPAGAEPHDWEPAPKDVKAIGAADLFVYNGAGFESWAEQALESLGPDKPLVLEASRGLTTQVYGATYGAVEDPHVWLDPTLARRQVAAIATTLSNLDPEHRKEYEARAGEVIARLDDLDAAFRDGLRDCERREMVASHAAFGYLAWRYGLELIPILGLDPEAEPTPTEMASLVALAQEKGVRYVFFESLVSPRVAETLAREINAKTLPLNPLEGLTKKEQAQGKDYVSVMRQNLHNLRTALGCH